MIKVLLNGCCGKMGEVIVNSSINFPNIQIVAGVDKYINNNYKFQIFTDINDVNIDYDVLIDFSRADALKGLLDFSIKNNKPLILCSTGYSEDDLKLIYEKSNVIPVFKSANMSLGINLISSLLRKVAPVLYGNYDIEIIEKHHNQKVDSPSGTAILLADSIKSSLSEETKYVYGREGSSKREKNEIGIHAVRGGSIVGDHDVIFAGAGEIIELSHKALSREVFAIGALKAAEYMYTVKSPKLYNMEDVLNI